MGRGEWLLVGTSALRLNQAYHTRWKGSVEKLHRRHKAKYRKLPLLLVCYTIIELHKRNKRKHTHFVHQKMGEKPVFLLQRLSPPWQASPNEAEDFRRANSFLQIAQSKKKQN